MKKLWNFLWMFPLTAALTAGCQSDDITYSDKAYVAFADTVYTMPVEEKEAAFTVPVAATTTASYDRNYAVEVVNEKSNVIRGFHFDFVDNTNNIQRMRINYADGQLLLPVSKKTDIGGGIYDWTYRYDAERRLIGIDYVENKGAEDELSATEGYDYIQTDSYGNWTQSVRQQQSAVDWSHEDGTFKAYRKIMY